MNDTNISREMPNYILAQAPVLLASLGGLIVALRLRRKAPASSLWAAEAFGLGIFTCALVGIGHAVESEATTIFIGPVLRATTYVLLLIGVYAGRTSPSATPAVSPETVWQNVASTIRARPGLLAVSRVVFASVFLVVVITATLVTFVMPESFVSTARLRLGFNPTNVPEKTGPPSTSGGYDPLLIQTECEVIRSEGILGKVIEDLDLNKEWGKRFAGGDRLKTSETMAILRGRIGLRPVPNTSVIEIRSYGEKADEAAKVANAIAEAYRDHINSPELAAATSRAARVEMAGMPAPASKPMRPDSAATMTNRPWVEILDHAVPGLTPIRPNKPLNITLGVLTGLVLGLLVGAGAWWVGLQVGKKPSANPQS